MANALIRKLSSALQKGSGPAFQFPLYGYSGAGAATYGSGGWLDRFLPGADYDYIREAQPFQKNAIISGCLGKSLPLFAQPKLVVNKVIDQGKKTQVITEHPVLDIMHNPNEDGDTLTSMLQAWKMDRDLFGNDYWFRIENRIGNTIGFQHVQFASMTPWPDKDPRVLVGAYGYWINGKWLFYPPEQIVHWKFGRDPENIRMGISLLKAACRDICTENELSTMAASVARNMGIAPYFIQPLLTDKQLEDGDIMPMEVANKMSTQLNEKTRDKRGKALIMRQPVKIDRLAFSPQELDSPTTRDQAATRICMALGMDPMLIGAPSNTRTFSNYPEARSAYFEDNIMPEGIAFCEKLNKLFHMEGQLAPDEHLAFNSDEVPAFQEGRAARAKEADDGFKSGRLTLNEARAACGEPPSDDDGFIWQLIPGVKIDGAVVPQSVNKPMEPGGAAAKWMTWQAARREERRIKAERNGHATSTTVL